ACAVVANLGAVYDDLHVTGVRKNAYAARVETAFRVRLPEKVAYASCRAAALFKRAVACCHQRFAAGAVCFGHSRKTGLYELFADVHPFGGDQLPDRYLTAAANHRGAAGRDKERA